MDGKSNDLEQMIKALPDCIDFRIIFLETMLKKIVLEDDRIDAYSFILFKV